MCDSMVASPAVERDIVLARTCGYPPYMWIEWGRFVIFIFALPASISGNGFQVLVLIAFGAHEKGNKLTFLVLCLLAFGKNKGNVRHVRAFWAMFNKKC